MPWLRPDGILEFDPTSIPKRPFHHLFRMVARRSISSDVRTERFEFEGWYPVLRRNGTRMDRTTLIRPAVEPLVANLENSRSRVRKVAQSGSREVGCGIVRLVSTVDCEVFSDALLAVAVSVSGSVSTDGARWDEVREVVELTLLYEGFFATAGELGALIGADAEGESLVVAPLPTEVLRLIDEELLEKTFCGFCLIFVR
jgi:hypothetical protein